MNRFIDSWYLLLKFLNHIMNTHPDELLSVNPKKGNSAGDVVKGRTCRQLNVTGKIFIRDIDDIKLLSQDGPILDWYESL